MRQVVQVRLNRDPIGINRHPLRRKLSGPLRLVYMVFPCKEYLSSHECQGELEYKEFQQIQYLIIRQDIREPLALQVEQPE